MEIREAILPTEAAARAFAAGVEWMNTEGQWEIPAIHKRGCTGYSVEIREKDEYIEGKGKIQLVHVDLKEKDTLIPLLGAHRGKKKTHNKRG